MYIDSIIFITFLIITLFIGIRYGSKLKTLKDYALGDKNFSTITISATITATYMLGPGDLYSGLISDLPLSKLKYNKTFS